MFPGTDTLERCFPRFLPYAGIFGASSLKVNFSLLYLPLPELLNPQKTSSFLQTYGS